MDLNRLGRGVYGNAIARLFGLDDLNAVPTLAPEIMPTTDIWSRPEFWALLGGSLGMCRAAFAAGGAGQRGVVQVRNPNGSGMIVVVEQAVIGIATLHEWGLIAATFGSSINRTHRDIRRGLGDSTAGLAAIAEGGIGASATPMQGAMLGPGPVKLDIVLPPGFGVRVHGPDNGASDATLFWRERAATNLELLLG